MPSFQRHRNRLSSGKSKKNQETKSLPLRLTFTEQGLPDDYIIRSFDDLFSKTVRVWNSGTWNNNVMNGATGTLFNSSHHVPHGGAKSRKAFKAGTFGFCLEWIDFEHEGTIHRVRCMNEFSVKSQQCMAHSKTVYKDGPNRVYDLLNWKETVTWGMIKDADAREGPLTDDQLKSKAVDGVRDLQVKRNETHINSRDFAELNARMSVKERAISNKAYLLERRSGTTVAASQLSSSGAIYNARRSSSNSAPGNAILDEKAKRNPNDKKKSRITYAKAPALVKTFDKIVE